MNPEVLKLVVVRVEWRKHQQQQRWKEHAVEKNGKREKLFEICFQILVLRSDRMWLIDHFMKTKQIIITYEQQLKYVIVASIQNSSSILSPVRFS